MITLGPFELEEPIGRGGMGEVWSATHTTQRVPVAVKVLSSSVFQEETYRHAFRNEIRSVAGLQHPHIVTVFDHGEVSEEEALDSETFLPGMPYLAMEMAGGGSLTKRRGRLPWPDIRSRISVVKSESEETVELMRQSRVGADVGRCVGAVDCNP